LKIEFKLCGKASGVREKERASKSARHAFEINLISFFYFFYAHFAPAAHTSASLLGPSGKRWIVIYIKAKLYPLLAIMVVWLLLWNVFEVLVAIG